MTSIIHTVNVLKFLSTFLFLFSIKMLGCNSQNACQNSKQGLHCLSILLRLATSVRNFRTFTLLPNFNHKNPFLFIYHTILPAVFVEVNTCLSCYAYIVK